VLNSLLEGAQSALAPRGPAAADTAEIAWVLFAGAAVVLAVVVMLTGYAVFGRRERAARLDERWLIVGGGIVFPAIVLSALLAWTVARGMTDGLGDKALAIEVIGEQWWWRVHYLDGDGRRDFTTANEVRIPAGRTIELRLASADVVHSFWVPALAGKLDMIPGRTNRLRVRADRPGEFRAQCAEYCGGPHALMALYVLAEPPEAFERWAAAQRQVAASPATELQQRGRTLLLANCATCHTVRGTPAAGLRGPDLTHLASRRSIGAGLLPASAGAYAAWIRSSQQLKPGNLMPSFESFGAEDLRALAAYLESLR
jgi:cytochrome c oxidase subunit 2